MKPLILLLLAVGSSGSAFAQAGSFDGTYRGRLIADGINHPQCRPDGSPAAWPIVDNHLQLAWTGTYAGLKLDAPVVNGAVNGSTDFRDMSGGTMTIRIIRVRGTIADGVFTGSIGDQFCSYTFTLRKT
jgi:hypothetical protein